MELRHRRYVIFSFYETVVLRIKVLTDQHELCTLFEKYNFSRKQTPEGQMTSL